MQQVLDRLKESGVREVFDYFPRQSGKTTACAHYALEIATEGGQVCVVLPYHTLLREFKEMILNIHWDNEYFRLSPVYSGLGNTIQFTNGGKINLVSQYIVSRPFNSITSYDVCIMDEYVHFDNFEEVYQTIRPICSKIVGVGTPREMETPFYAEAAGEMRRRVINEVQESDLREDTDEDAIEDTFTKDAYLRRLGILEAEETGRDRPEPEENTVWRI